jgi:23S rRNA (guanosine2251-2'-O)-methyltransferase
VLADSAEEVADACEALGIRQITAATRGGRDLRRLDWSGPLALWIGSETGRLPAVCERFEGVSIPMAGSVESLNVTVAASLLLFAAGRTQPTEEDPEP